MSVHSVRQVHLERALVALVGLFSQWIHSRWHHKPFRYSLCLGIVGMALHGSSVAAIFSKNWIAFVGILIADSADMNVDQYAAWKMNSITGSANQSRVLTRASVFKCCPATSIRDALLTN